MKIVIISDTHSNHRNIALPNGDVLIHAGDMTFRGEKNIIQDFNEWLGTLHFKHKIIIAGNHELGFGQLELNEKKKLFSNGIYLEDSSIEIDGINFYGSPWTPHFYSWEFNFPKESLAYSQAAHDAWDKIPDNTDVLITHGPSYGILDIVNHPNGDEDPHVGCKYLRDRLIKLPNLKYHLFGHIHEGYGSVNIGNLTSINASTLNDRYRIANKPVIIEI